jgi:hypothetical protein
MPIRDYLRQFYIVNNNTEEENIRPITDIGIEDIRNARTNAEHNGSNNIPEEILEAVENNDFAAIIRSHNINREIIGEIPRNPEYATQGRREEEIERIEEQLIELRERENPHRRGTPEFIAREREFMRRRDVLLNESRNYMRSRPQNVIMDEFPEEIPPSTYAIRADHSLPEYMQRIYGQTLDNNNETETDDTIEELLS